MDKSSPTPANPIPLDAKSRRWAIRVVTVLSIVESLLLVGAGSLGLLYIDWENEIVAGLPTGRVLDALVLALIFIPLALVGLLVVVGLFIGRRNAWAFAMALQGLVLFATLDIYWNEIRPNLLYLVMIYAILMALYLNSSDVRVAFFAKQPNQALPNRDY